MAYNLDEIVFDEPSDETFDLSTIVFDEPEEVENTSQTGVDNTVGSVANKELNGSLKAPKYDLSKIEFTDVPHVQPSNQNSTEREEPIYQWLDKNIVNPAQTGWQEVELLYDYDDAMKIQDPTERQNKLLELKSRHESMTSNDTTVPFSLSSPSTYVPNIIRNILPSTRKMTSPGRYSLADLYGEANRLGIDVDTPEFQAQMNVAQGQLAVLDGLDFFSSAFPVRGLLKNTAIGGVTGGISSLGREDVRSDLFNLSDEAKAENREVAGKSGFMTGALFGALPETPGVAVKLKNADLSSNSLGRRLGAEIDAKQKQTKPSESEQFDTYEPNLSGVSSVRDDVPLSADKMEAKVIYDELTTEVSMLKDLVDQGGTPSRETINNLKEKILYQKNLRTKADSENVTIPLRKGLDKIVDLGEDLVSKVEGVLPNRWKTDTKINKANTEAKGTLISNAEANVNSKIEANVKSKVDSSPEIKAASENLDSITARKGALDTELPKLKDKRAKAEINSKETKATSVAAEAELQKVKTQGEDKLKTKRASLKLKQKAAKAKRNKNITNTSEAITRSQQANFEALHDAMLLDIETKKVEADVAKAEETAKASKTKAQEAQSDAIKAKQEVVDAEARIKEAVAKIKEALKEQVEVISRVEGDASKAAKEVADKELTSYKGALDRATKPVEVKDTKAASKVAGATVISTLGSGSIINPVTLALLALPVGVAAAKGIKAMSAARRRNIVRQIDAEIRRLNKVPSKKSSLTPEVAETIKQLTNIRTEYADMAFEEEK